MKIYIYTLATCLVASLSVYADQNSIYYGDQEYQCPRHWIKFQDSCYRFIESPIKRRDEARETCQAYQSDLLSINSVEEHTFMLQYLRRHDLLRRKWYTGVRHLAGFWSNEADGSQLINMENTFLPEPNDGITNRDYLAYVYSKNLDRWGLEKVTGHDGFLYICEAAIVNLHSAPEDERDYQYGIEVDNPLRVERGPYFILQPENKVFDVSKRNLLNEVTLKCLAGGYPTPTYEWFIESYDNGRLMAMKIDPLANNKYTTSGGNLIIYKPEESDDRGSYHCKASNEFGTIISESVDLTFGYILEFNLKRSQEKGEQNVGKVMYCDPPQHFPSVKYYWARDYFPNFVEEDQRVFVSNDGALYFSALEPIDAGNYSCNVQSVTSDVGRNGPLFPLKVDPYASFQQLKFSNNFPKIFPEAPIVGEDVRLECIAFGYPVPSYSWVRADRAKLPSTAVFSSFNRVLTIHRVRVEDQGEYICRAKNGRLSIENSVYMSIQAEPNFTIPLEDKHMDSRGELTWTCEAFGIPDVSYSWYKNGELLEMHTLPIEDRDRYFIYDNVLKIKYLDRERDEGMYQCRAKNQLKARYSSAQLRILTMKPSFKKHPMEPETYAADRGNITLKCNPEAAPRPTFVWKKDGNVLGSGGRRRILENGNLIISPVSRDDEGLYVCSATNTYGSDETRGRLLVLRGPEFIEQLLPRQHAAIMENQTFSCQADTDSILDIAYIWRHKGIEIRDQDLINNPRWKIDGGTFNIINVSLSDAGEFECIIKSAVGSVTSKSMLEVDGPPGPPGGVKVNIDKMSVTLEWIDGAFNGKPILMYTVSARTAFSDKWFNLTQNITAIEIDRYSGRKQANLEGILNPFTTYEFRVSAANELGYGPPSESSPKHSTPPAKPTRSPTNVSGGYGKQGELTITWDPLPPAYQNGRGIYYKIYWRRKGHESEFQSRSLKSYGNIGKYTVEISPEFYYTEYEVQVQPFNEAGEGPISNIATIYSAEDMPLSQPKHIVAFSYNSTSLNVTWDPLENTREIIRGKLIGYRLKYWRLQDKEEEAIFYLSRTTRPWSLIVGLQPDTEYWVKVMAYNSAGAGPESERQLERTYRKAPQNPPSSVFIYEKNPSTVRVVWRYVQPSLDEEPLDGYKIRVWEFDQDMSTANDTIVTIGDKLEAYVTNLSPGKIYNLRVLAFSKGGDGRMSSPARTFQMGDPAMFRSRASYRILDTGVIISVLLMMIQLDFI